MEDGGDRVQEAIHDTEDAQALAWKVAGDGEVLDVDVRAEQDQTRQDQTVVWQPQAR